MVDEFGQREMRVIGDPDGTGEMVLERVQGALAKASEQIDFAASQRCALPLVITNPSTASFLKQLCMDIARYRLTGSSGITATDEVRDRFNAADGKLNQIIAGKIVLCEQNSGGAPGGNGLQPEGLTAGEVEFDTAPRVFSPRGLRDFMGGTR
jgi:phage gp36-like protein